MDTLAIALLGFFAAAYFVLAGSDIGTGMLAPYLGRSDRERRLVIASFAPFFLGNEVWLVATAGLLIGCFPDLEGELLSGQFPVVVALLAGWIVRDMGLWMRGRVGGGPGQGGDVRSGPGPDGSGGGRGWRLVCDTAVTGGSWVLALSWGWLLAGLFSGSPDTPASGPVAVLTALAVAGLFAVHGLGFAVLRLTGDPYARARVLVGRAARPWHSFALTAALMAALPLLAGLGLPLTESAGTSVDVLVPALLVVTPLLVVVQAWMWRTFRGRVTRPSYL
ncbi:cytochrome d ubiquinol oxidase subunit II [Streptomyces indicus]|uniref:Cytochrome bd-type quinol oxidase, subunit 2 n=1 Tax=Streptomyces indicus TaxID=417292 RepID=A0A1G9B3Q2_9ACTN|nr:cytochrome d ubiquinol oxidase subunit II [Streptomyces indicus]SDK33620.1 Cytochrome bd-type quinol oxidase, subunit 2 [Streptomyces indicus]